MKGRTSLEIPPALPLVSAPPSPRAPITREDTGNLQELHCWVVGVNQSPPIGSGFPFS